MIRGTNGNRSISSDPNDFIEANSDHQSPLCYTCKIDVPSE